MVAEVSGKRARTPARRKPAPKAMAGPLASALRTIGLEADGLLELAAALAGPMARPFEDAVKVLGAKRGRVIVTGIGKAGHISHKIAATLASTGTPAFFVHPSEASHGDLGMITPEDAILAISWSGESVELKNIITYSRRFSVPLIALTSSRRSTLGQHSDIVLELPRAPEACPHGLAPTTSTTMQLALGDALAVALLEARGFTAHDFKVFHPGGSLGAQLKLVGDVMHKGDRLPLAREGSVMAEALLIMTAKSFGCLGIIDKAGKLTGMITDGDLRRHMGEGLVRKPVTEIMTRDPKTLAPSQLASAALDELNKLKRTQAFVVEDDRPVGIVHIHDFLRIGIA